MLLVWYIYNYRVYLCQSCRYNTGQTSIENGLSNILLVSFRFGISCCLGEGVDARYLERRDWVFGNKESVRAVEIFQNWGVCFWVLLLLFLPSFNKYYYTISYAICRTSTSECIGKHFLSFAFEFVSRYILHLQWIVCSWHSVYNTVSDTHTTFTSY